MRAPLLIEPVFPLTWRDAADLAGFGFMLSGVAALVWLASVMSGAN